MLLLVACGRQTASHDSATTVENETTMPAISLLHDEQRKKVEVRVDGALFTAYLYGESLKKPILYPLKSSSGMEVTRGFPLAPRAGERVDHPHQAGLWFNFGDVNGLDFWNNSDSVKGERLQHMGLIRHREIVSLAGGSGAELQVRMDWLTPRHEPLLAETARFVFTATEDARIIDRISTLTALEEQVFFRDNKEGMLGIRVAREMAQPDTEAVLLTDASGRPAKLRQVNNNGVTGKYRGSSGLEGDAVWGTRNQWVRLDGILEGKEVTIAIIDHVANPGHPAHWHARGYGLFAANNFARKAMGGGEEEQNFTLEPGASATFRYRIIIQEGGQLTDSVLNSYATAFAQQYQ
ncbi:PmoA family protein [Cesiribacter sp. SM1]|uniref:DUF6807 domain-containing protein n=1 Tax=Cesiribacter sp. SM1 TaxID=2861196 RepID=UPI001CD63619|nr:PmoA family protein [Cesiribacter sp. SM1]